MNLDHMLLFCVNTMLFLRLDHACGHNLIAEVGVGAGIGIKAALDSVEGKLGKVSENDNFQTNFSNRKYVILQCEIFKPGQSARRTAFITERKIIQCHSVHRLFNLY